MHMLETLFGSEVLVPSASYVADPKDKTGKTFILTKPLPLSRDILGLRKSLKVTLKKIYQLQADLEGWYPGKVHPVFSRRIAR